MDNYFAESFGVALELKNIIGQLDRPGNSKGRLPRWDRALSVIKALT